MVPVGLAPVASVPVASAPISSAPVTSTRDALAPVASDPAIAPVEDEEVDLIEADDEMQDKTKKMQVLMWWRISL